MMLATSLEEAIADNFIMILILIVLLAMISIIAYAVIKTKKLTTEKVIAQVNMESRKIDAISNRYKMEDLREAAAMLTDDEREKIEGIKIDKGVLARRSIALMNEVEERTSRLERAIDNAKLGKTLREIKDQEKKLFKK